MKMYIASKNCLCMNRSFSIFSKIIKIQLVYIDFILIYVAPSRITET